MKEKAKIKPLIVTGTLANGAVKEHLSKSKIKSRVISLPIQVAALMNTKFIAKKLKSMILDDIDLILVPGLAFGDAETITDSTNIPAYKGPKYAADLPFILNGLNRIELSARIPACELIRERLRKSNLKELVDIRKREEEKIKSGIGISIGTKSNKVWIDRELGPRILAEIVDAPTLPDTKIRDIASYFSQSGADIIDIGMLSERSDPKQVKRIIKVLKKVVNNPISIDSGYVDEIRTAVAEGIDLILSINAQNMKEISEFALNVPVVVTPVDKNGLCSRNIIKRIDQLRRNLDSVASYGFKKIIADPILNPPFSPSLMDSISGYFEFAKKNSKTPILLGLSNVTELVDCDSYGVNLLLASLGLELGASIILVTEASDKTYGCVKEVATAIDMVVLARNRNGPPKDLGLSLLKLKEKRRTEEIYDKDIESKMEKIEVVRSEQKPIHDPKGSFKIMIDRFDRKIVVIHLRPKDFKPDIILKATEPLNIYKEIVDRGLISTMEHSFYLGIELSKAKEALTTEKSYVQDNPFFEKSI